MESTDNCRERSSPTFDLEKIDGQVQVTTQQKAQLKEHMSKNSGILEGRFFGPLQKKQADLWKKLKDQLNQNGAQFSVPEWKKVWWDLKKEVKEKSPLNDSVPNISGTPEDEDVMVVLEKRRIKMEDMKEESNLKSDGRNQKHNPRSGSENDDTYNRNQKSLSPVSSDSTSCHSRLSSISPPKIGNIKFNKAYTESSKASSKYKRSPSHSHPPSHYRKKSAYHSKNRKSRSPSWSRSSAKYCTRLRSKSPLESREPLKKRYRSKSPAQRIHNYKGNYLSEKNVWEVFRAEVDALEAQRWSNEQQYEKNPEKHPDYKLEWKKFYRSHVKELLNCGKDPKLYNFESEWAYFWKWRMDELLKTDFERKKDAVRRGLGLTEEESKPHYKAPKSSRVREMNDDRYPSSAIRSLSERSERNPGLISTLRIVTAVEEQLGSLGPQVNGLLSQSVALQRIDGSNPDTLISNQDNIILLETVREKLLGQIQSKIVKKTLVVAVKEAIDSIDNLLKTVPSPKPLSIQNYMSTMHHELSCIEGIAPVNVPGVGDVDRVAIAQQIADALVKHGKTNVTEAELQELVSAVVGVAKTKSIHEKSKQSMLFAGENYGVQEVHKLSSSLPLDSNQITTSEVVTSLPNSGSTTQTSSWAKENAAFNMLMSVMQSGVRKTNPAIISLDYFSDESDTESLADKINSKKPSGYKLISKNLINDSILPDVGKDQSVEVITDFKKKLEKGKICSLLESYHSSTGSYKRVGKGIFKELSLRKAKKDEKIRVVESKSNRQLSPFSSREESSNPLPSSSGDENKDLKIIGAWDSDSDIDLDSYDKTKAPAYEKGKQPSYDKSKKSRSTFFKHEKAVQKTGKNTTLSSKSSLNTNLNLNVAIDDIMGSLISKTSEKQELSTGECIPIIKPSSERYVQSNSMCLATCHHSNTSNPNYVTPYHPHSTETQLTESAVLSNISTPSYSIPSSQYAYGTLHPSNYNSIVVASSNQYNSTPYTYQFSGDQPTTQNYYGGGASEEYGQMDTQYQGYYNYQSNFPANPRIEAHSTNFQTPYQ